jgi:hypothetical protein
MHKQKEKRLLCNWPVATNIPPVKINAPLGTKKQKNKPVWAYTARNMISNPPYCIIASALKTDSRYKHVLKKKDGIIYIGDVVWHNVLLLFPNNNTNTIQ